MNRWTRKLHRWGALLTFIPLFLVITTGLLLQVKKQVTWVQPATQRGKADDPQLEFAEILEIAKSDPSAAIQSTRRSDSTSHHAHAARNEVNRWAPPQPRSPKHPRSI